jgi:hypothetical protein
MNPEDLSVHRYYADQRYGLRITHIPTGVTIDGNVGMQDRLPNLQQELTNLLEYRIKDAPILPVKLVQTRNDYLEEAAKVADSYVYYKDVEPSTIARSIAAQIRKRKDA